MPSKVGYRYKTNADPVSTIKGKTWHSWDDEQQCPGTQLGLGPESGYPA
jgi:hypothetical protein